jgi:hypothetical protein
MLWCWSVSAVSIPDAVNAKTAALLSHLGDKSIGIHSRYGLSHFHTITPQHYQFLHKNCLAQQHFRLAFSLLPFLPENQHARYREIWQSIFLASNIARFTYFFQSSAPEIQLNFRY